MKIHLFLLGAIASLLTASCGRKPVPAAQIQAFWIGQTDHARHSKLFHTGGNAIRIDNGTAVLRMFRISKGMKVKEFEQILDSAKHPMAWTAPQEDHENVGIQFRVLEDTGWGHARLAATIPFEKPYLVGTSMMHSSLIVADAQALFFHYWITKEKGVGVTGEDAGSEAAMLKASETKPVEFLLVTVANK